MSVEIRRVIKCDECFVVKDFATDFEIANAKRILKERGWKSFTTRDGKSRDFCCNQCRKNYLEKVRRNNTKTK